MDPSLRWPIGIATAFFILFLVDGAYIWTAVHVVDPVDPSYKATPR